jgi:hypothetical protein
MFTKANRETPFLSKEDLKTLSETATRVFLSSHPNPERKGCPDPRALRGLAFLRTTKDAMEITLHLGECSDCFRDFADFSQQYKESRRRLWLGVGAAAAVALVVAGTLYFGVRNLNTLSPKPDGIANTTHGVEPAPVASPSTNEVAKAEAPLPVVDYQLVSPTRGPETSVTQPKELILKRERVQLRIHLPLGSEEGTYEVRVHRASDKKQMVKYERTANKRNSYTITIEEDFSRLAAGSYLLVVFAPGITGEVQGYPMRIVDRQSQ